MQRLSESIQHLTHLVGQILWHKRLRQQDLIRIQDPVMTNNIVSITGKNGMQLYEHLRTIMPNLKVLYISGRTGKIIDKRGINKEIFIGKPFLPDDLLHKINHIIEST